MKITIQKGDITKVEVDAIVNAANRTLLGGGGVDGAIHRAAGPELLEECKALPILKSSLGVFVVRCETGDAKITKGYNLSAKFVIHTVGPDCRESGVSDLERNLLGECWMNSLKKAHSHNLKSIAFPSISTGVFGFPIKEAANIAITSLLSFSALHPKSSIEDVKIICFSDMDREFYVDAADVPLHTG